MKPLFFCWICFFLWFGDIQGCWGQSVPDSLLSIHAFRQYHPDSHRLALKYSYYTDHWTEQKIRHGTWTRWDPEGEVLEKRSYRHGVLEGRLESYRPGGVLRRRASYRNGLLEGPSWIFTPTGRLKRLISFRAGLRHGASIRYGRDGQVRRQRMYVEGSLQKGLRSPKIVKS